MNENKAVFLDRDGVINREIGNYVWKTEDYELIDGIGGSLKKLKDAGFFLIVITNQAGIAKGLYSAEDVNKLHQYTQEKLGGVIDQFYFAPYHPNFSESLTRKPDSLMFEKGMAKFNINPKKSWMIGDKERDLIPAKKFGMKTILVDSEGIKSDFADFYLKNSAEMDKIILH